jgi:cytochrome P450
MPKGFVLAAQGITSGRLWDKATTGLLSLDGADHNRLRRLVCKAFTARSYAVGVGLGRLECGLFRDHPAVAHVPVVTGPSRPGAGR